MRGSDGVAWGMRPRIFFIGFNKCGTSSLHRWLCDAGVNSFHGGADRGGVDVAIMINIAQGRPALDGVDRHDAYLDLRMLHQRFRDFERDYPGSKFVLNTRPVERWLQSRINHLNGAYVPFLNLYHDISLTSSEWADRWRREFVEHEAAVQQHFQSSRSPYLRFDIESDRPAALAAFLQIGAANELPRENVTISSQAPNPDAEDETVLRRRQVDDLGRALSEAQEQLRAAEDEIQVRRQQVSNLGEALSSTQERNRVAEDEILLRRQQVTDLGTALELVRAQTSAAERESLARGEQLAQVQLQASDLMVRAQQAESELASIRQSRIFRFGQWLRRVSGQRREE